MNGSSGPFRDFANAHCPKNPVTGGIMGTPTRVALCHSGHIAWHTVNIPVKHVLNLNPSNNLNPTTDVNQIRNHLNQWKRDMFHNK